MQYNVCIHVDEIIVHANKFATGIHSFLPYVVVFVFMQRVCVGVDNDRFSGRTRRFYMAFATVMMMLQDDQEH